MSHIEQTLKYVSLLQDFKEKSHEILPSKLSQYQSSLTFLLALLSFVSVSITLLNRKGNVFSYLFNAIIASVLIAFCSIYTCNYFGVYI